MPPKRALTIVVGLALSIIYGYRAYLEAKKHWTGLQSLWEVIIPELAKSDPMNLVLLALGITAIAVGTSDLWLNRHLRFERNPTVLPRSWEIGEWTVDVRNQSPTKTITGVRVVLVSYRRAEWNFYATVRQELMRATGPADLSPDDMASFRLVGFRFDDATQMRTVCLAPGTPNGAMNWLPRGNYHFKVKAYGQGSTPATEEYILTFIDDARVSLAPAPRWYQLGA
jgi:hypothetical protein